MLTINNVKVAGISVTVPNNIVDNYEFGAHFGEKEIQRLIKSIGVQTRHTANPSTFTSDLCCDAAERIFTELNIDRSTVGAVVFVTQTADVAIPSTACIIQDRLKLPNTTIAFDVNQGCSGYVYGLYIASSLMQGGLKRVLLLVGDTSSKGIDPQDRSTALLFGDSGSATILEYDEKAPAMTFELGTDGAGWEAIVARKLSHIELDEEEAPGRQRNFLTLEMDGAAVFEFTLSRVPPLVNQFIVNNKLTPDDISLCVYHQANAYMLKNLAKKSNLSIDKVPVSIGEFGNTSCTSIAVTLAAYPADEYARTLLVGFGVGLSWGAALCDLSSTRIMPIHYYGG